MNRAKTFGIVTVGVVVALMAGLWWMRGEGVGPDGCPKKSGPSREIIVLLDTSDPLNDKHRADLDRILREMTDPEASGRHTALAVRAGERVSFYELSSTGPPESPLEQICTREAIPRGEAGSITSRRGASLTSGAMIDSSARLGAVPEKGWSAATCVASPRDHRRHHRASCAERASEPRHEACAPHRHLRSLATHFDVVALRSLPEAGLASTRTPERSRASGSEPVPDRTPQVCGSFRRRSTITGGRIWSRS